MKNKILIIEDNTEVRENIAEILNLAGYDTELAENGKEGVSKALLEKPNLILCDIMMPELDGYGVLHIIARNPNLSTIPFIFLTAKAEKEDIKKGLGLGADDYITKPFDDDELLKRIERRLNKIESLNKSLNEINIKKLVDESRGEEVIRNISSKYELKEYRRKECIVSQNAKPNFLYYLTKGKVKCVIGNDDGKEKINKIYVPGEFFGHIEILSARSYNEDYICLEDVELHLIPGEVFLDLIVNNRDVTTRVIKLLAKNVYEKEEQLLKLAYDTVRKKIADALIYFYDQYDKPKEGLKIFRDDLAAYVGTAKETVIRTLSEFKADKLIEIEDNRINILNIEKLRNLPY